MTSVEKFRARKVKGHKPSVVVEELMKASGYSVTNTTAEGKRIRCIRTLVDLATKDEAMFREIWPLLVEAHSGGPFSERIVEGLAYLHIATEGRINQGTMRKRIVNLGREGLIAAINRAAAYYARGGNRVFALGIAEAVNKGLHVANRIQVE